MKMVFSALFSLLMLTACSSVKIIDANPDNVAMLLKSEMSGLSPSQTNTQGNWQSTLEYINLKLKYGQKIFYSTTLKQFVFAKASNSYTLFEMNEVDMDSSIIQRLGGGTKRTDNKNKVLIAARDPAKGFAHVNASGKKSSKQFIVLDVDVASDAIKVKNAFALMTDPANIQ